MSRALWPYLHGSVTPIGMYAAGNNIWQHGTGTFFQVAESRHFLVSAAHVFYEDGRNIEGLCVFDAVIESDGTPRLQNVPISGQLLRMEGLPDLAVMELDRSVVDRLSGRRFLRLADAQLHPSYPGWYYVYGFPRCDGKPGPRGFHPGELTLGARACHSDAALPNFDPGYHFLLDANERQMHSQSTGERASLPRSLQGMSGCSVWQTLCGTETVSDRWDPASIRVAGVQIGHYPNVSLIKCAAWLGVAQILWSQCPDLRPALRMHFDPR